MKKFAAMILALVMVLSFAACAQADRLADILAKGEITFATSPDFAPSEFIDPNKTGDDQYVGCDVELAKYIAEKLGVKLVIKPMDFGALQGAITQGKIDMAISGFAYTEERAENMQLSAFFNMETDDSSGQGILVLKDKAADLAKAEDFAKKTIAAQNASLQYNLVTSQLPDAKVKLIANLNDAIMMLITGRVDAVAVDADNGAMFCANYDQLTMSDFYFDYSSEGNVLAVTKGEEALIAEINKIIAEVNELGLYEQWKADATELAKSLGIDVN